MDYHFGLAKMRVQFVIKHAVSFGKNLYVGGSNSELGSWNTSKGLKLQWGKDNIWYLDYEFLSCFLTRCAEVDITSDSNVVYKYYVKDEKYSICSLVNHC
jgi:hypothetical protein